MRIAVQSPDSSVYIMYINLLQHSPHDTIFTQTNYSIHYQDLPTTPSLSQHHPPNCQNGRPQPQDYRRCSHYHDCRRSTMPCANPRHRSSSCHSCFHRDRCRQRPHSRRSSSGAVAGGVSGAVVKGSSKPPKRGLTESAKFRLTRRGEYAPSINQHDYDRCINEVNGQGVPVTFSDSEHGRVYSFVWDRR
jgi:hypothetical protein